MIKFVITPGDVVGFIVVGLFILSFLYLYIAGKIYDNQTKRNRRKLEKMGFIFNNETRNFERGDEVLDSLKLINCNYSYKRYKKEIENVNSR